MPRNASTGAYTMPASTVRPAVSGTTISSTDFNNQCADTETALSYVYGTFTPTLGDGTNLFTLSTATGVYTQIGNIVFYFINCTWTSIGSAGAAQLRIGGLPVTCVNAGGFTFCDVSGFDTNGGANFITATGGGSTTQLFFRTCSDNANSAGLAANSCSATGKVVGNGFYGV